MSEEIKRVLKMVGEGKLTIEQGTELIEAIKGKEEELAPRINNDNKMFKVKVKGSEEDNVDINIPIKFIKNITGAIKNMPVLKENGVDVEMIMEAIDSGVEGKILDIKTGDGEIVEVVIE